MARLMLNRCLHAHAGLTGMSGYEVIDPHELLAGRGKRFHEAAAPHVAAGAPLAFACSWACAACCSASAGRGGEKHVHSCVQ